MNLRSLTLLPVLATMMGSTAAVAQEAASPELAARIDELFAWVAPDAPGCVVGIARDGKVVVNRAYGVADLERRTPLTTETRFDIGSLQKQFVAAAVLLLVQDGRVALDDDIHRFVPELPDYGDAITVDHLLTHTSGLRDWTALLQMSRADETALAAILRQRGLNFAPGEEWSYSNSGYVLLKELVARVSGMPFGEFARDRLFAPLGMSATSYVEDTSTAGPGLALAYQKTDDGWRPAMLAGNERGGGALLSTTGDLLTWNDALSSARLGGFVTAKLHEPARLNNGRVLSYARGLFLDDDEGGRVIWHTGSAAGYKALLGRFPQQGLSIALLSNAGDNAQRQAAGRGLVKLFIPDADSTAAPAEKAATSADAVDPARAGLYFSEPDGEPLRLVVNDGRLAIQNGPALDALPGDHFQNRERKLVFRSNDAFDLHFVAADAFELTSGEGAVVRYRRARPFAPTAADLQSAVGRYESDELAATIEVTAGADGLHASLNGSRALDLAPLERDVFQLGRMFLRFRRDGAGIVTELDYSNPVLRHVVFTREED